MKGILQILIGIVLIIIFVPLTKVPLLMFLIIISAILLLAFRVIIGSLSFYIGSYVKIANKD